MRSPRGFTLVEVVISLAVLSLISLLLLSSLRAFSDSQQRVNSTTERLSDVRAVTAFLRSTLRQTRVLAFNQTRPYFSGESDELLLLAPLRGAAGFSGLAFVRLRLEGDALQLQFLPALDAQDEPRWDITDEHVLLDDVSELNLAYREVGGGWEDDWRDTTRGLPAWIRIRLRSAGRFWPDIVIPLDQVIYGS